MSEDTTTIQETPTTDPTPTDEGASAAESPPAGAGEGGEGETPAADPPPERELTDEEKASIEKTGAFISDTLGEKYRGPRWQINQIVGILGEEQSMALLAKVQEIEANGGIMLPDNSRRRTPGGVFFHLAYHHMPPERRRGVYRYKHQRKSRDTGPPLPWSSRGELITYAREHGKTKEVKTVKITIVGTLGKTVEKNGFTLAMVKNTPNLDKLPRGIPRPEASETTYVIYIGSKQWQKVSHALRNPEDAAIIEGTPMWDEEYQAMAVFVNSITTKLTQQARREEQKAQAAKVKEQKPEPVAQAQATQEAVPEPEPVPQAQATQEATQEPEPVPQAQATQEATQEPEPVPQAQATQETTQEPEPVAQAAQEPAPQKKPSPSHSSSKKQKPGTRVSRNKKK